MMPSWVGILIVLAALGGLFAGLRWWQIHRRPAPETARKALHIGMGLITLSFPWLFSRPWPVILLSSLAVVAMIAIRHRVRLHQGLGRVLHEVDRKSLGEIYFPVSIGILFALSRGNPLLYCIPVLILTLGDAAAALVGVRRGRTKYHSADSIKSAEGSLAMFAISALFTLLPLLLAGDVAFVRALMVAMTIGLVAMLLEAIALEGRDNLYLPVAAFILLSIYLHLTLVQVVARFMILVLLLGFMILRRGRTTMDDGAVLGAVLVGYFSWAVGGWLWLMPVLVSFLVYTWIFPNPYAGEHRPHNIHAVIAASAGAIFWVVIQAAWPERDFTFSFVLAWMAQLALIGLISLCFAFPRRALSINLIISAACSWLVIFLTFLVLGRSLHGLGLKIALSLPAVILPALLFSALQPQIENCPKDGARWLRQGLCGWLGSLLGLLIIR